MEYNNRVEDQADNRGKSGRGSDGGNVKNRTRPDPRYFFKVVPVPRPVPEKIPESPHHSVRGSDRVRAGQH